MNEEKNLKEKTNQAVLWLTVLAVVIAIILYNVFISFGSRNKSVVTIQDETNNAMTEPKKEVQEPATFTGTSSMATSQFELKQGLRRAEYKHSGNMNFIVRLMDSNGDVVDILANEVGTADGSKAFKSDGGSYVLDVTASGEWSITLK